MASVEAHRTGLTRWFGFLVMGIVSLSPGAQGLSIFAQHTIQLHRTGDINKKLRVSREAAQAVPPAARDEEEDASEWVSPSVRLPSFACVRGTAADTQNACSA